MGITGLGGVKPKKEDYKEVKKAINLIYKHTHPDYRSASQGIKKVMYFDEKKGTVLSPIVNLPNKVFLKMLAFAKKKERK